MSTPVLIVAHSTTTVSGYALSTSDEKIRVELSLALDLDEAPMLKLECGFKECSGRFGDLNPPGNPR
jgi:hypothetical protein